MNQVPSFVWPRCDDDTTRRASVGTAWFDAELHKDTALTN